MFLLLMKNLPRVQTKHLLSNFHLENKTFQLLVHQKKISFIAIDEASKRVVQGSRRTQIRKDRLVWRCEWQFGGVTQQTHLQTPYHTLLQRGLLFLGVYNLRNSFDKSSLMHYLCVFEPLYFQWNVYATNFNIAAGLASKISQAKQVSPASQL